MTRHLSEEVRREQILEAARMAFVEAGYMPTRMEDIAKRAKLSKGGVYFHFNSKRDLFDALVQQEYELSMNFLELVRAREGTVRHKLELLGRYYPMYFAEHPEAARFFVVMSEVAMREPDIRERLMQMHQAYLEAISAVLEEGVASGELKPINTHAVAVLLKAVMDGLEGAFALGVSPAVEDLLTTGIGVLLSGMLSEESPALTDEGAAASLSLS